MKWQEKTVITPLTGQLTLAPMNQTTGPTTRPTKQNPPITDGEEEISSPSLRSDLEKNVIIPAEEIISINGLGQMINQPCSHPKIPGLDADFCKVCRIYWVDQKSRDLWFASRGRSA